jgi:nucleotide-binding universal stress UspA family protein
MFRRILVPLDGSTRAEQALLNAVRLARASGGSLFLVRVVPSPIKMTQQTVASSTRMREASDAGVAGVPAASDYLARLAASALSAGVATESEVITASPACVEPELAQHVSLVRNFFQPSEKGLKA